MHPAVDKDGYLTITAQKNTSNEDKGKITLSYTSKDQLEHFLALFSLKE